MTPSAPLSTPAQMAAWCRLAAAGPLPDHHRARLKEIAAWLARHATATAATTGAPTVKAARHGR